MIGSSQSGNLLEARWLLWAVTLFGVALIATTNLPWHLDDYDQAKQAYTSFEMVKQGHWFYQHTPRARLATKPPLVGWISATAFEATRSWTLAWRLPSIAAALALLLLLLRAGRQVAGTSGALVASSAFSFNLLTPRLGSLVRTDMPLALVTFAIGLLIWNHIRNNETWTNRDRIIVFLLLLAGAFIKGPIVHAFLLPGLLAYEIWRRRTGAASGWPGGWPWIYSLIPLAVWAYVGVRFVPGFQDQVVLREFFGRFSESVHTPQPFYFYLPHLLQKFAPWSLLLLMLAWLYWHRGPNETRDKRPDAGLVWLACWFVGGLVVMSMIPSKRVDRIFPLIPPLCLLVASLVGPVLQGRKTILAHRLAVASVFVAIALTTIYSVARIAVARRDHADALVEFGKTVRQWAAQADWRYAAVYGGDEGMLLYLDRLSFTEKDMLISEWNSGKLDAAIVPARDAQIYVDALQPRPVTFLRSRSRGEDKPDYVLLERKD